jgi:hypothetical protein
MKVLRLYVDPEREEAGIVVSYIDQIDLRAEFHVYRLGFYGELGDLIFAYAFYDEDQAIETFKEWKGDK